MVPAADESPSVGESELRWNDERGAMRAGVRHASKSGLKVRFWATRKPLINVRNRCHAWGYDTGIQCRQAYPLPYAPAVCQIPFTIRQCTIRRICLHEKVES